MQVQGRKLASAAAAAARPATAAAASGAAVVVGLVQMAWLIAQLL